MKIEKEVRYKVTNKIIKSVKNITTLLKAEENNIDIVMGYHGFESLSTLGYICRIRKKKEKILLESKKRIDSDKWIETEIEIKSIKDGYNFLSQIGMNPYLYINRIREIRKYDGLKIFIDKIDYLGTFIEFELEEPYDFNENILKDFLLKVGIDSPKQKLYGDIFKDKLLDPKFMNEFQNELKSIISDL